MSYTNIFYADHGSDITVRETYFKNVDKGTVIDVGAAKPAWISQSKHFGDNGWRRICIEPNPYFVELHKKAGTEIYEYACADFDSDEIVFQFVGIPLYNEQSCDMEGFSSIIVRKDYIISTGYSSVPIVEAKVKVRKLDTIISLLNLTSIDYVCVDTEGWEIEVMKGFDIERWKPKVILLEDSYLNGNKYSDYMDTRGYVRGIRINNNDQCYTPK